MQKFTVRLHRSLYERLLSVASTAGVTPEAVIRVAVACLLAPAPGGAALL